MLSTKPARKSMKIGEIRKKAEKLGIIPGKMKKAELIHTIQQTEGYMACFGSSNGECAQTKCCFRRDCLKLRL